ncbi:MAG: tail fiber domain-containing protein [Deltaproteobacteria bacterium]|nr:tail fiber domain-containing protein [Deltaproteobacteria bacterium]
MRRQAINGRMLASILGFLVYADPHAGWAVGFGFTFQGQLQQSGTLQNGSCDFQFSLYNAASAGTKLGVTQTVSGVVVSDGLFTVTLNAANEFGSSAFDGTDRWLEIALRCPAGSGSFGAAFAPRQALTATPYALYAPSSGSSSDVACSGCVGSSDLASDSVTTIKILDGAVTGAKIADGTIATVDLANAAVTPAKLQPGSTGQVLTTTGGGVSWQTPSSGSSGWALTGNTGTNGSINFLGTTDAQPLELRANSTRILRLEPTDGVIGTNVLVGDYRNYLATGVQGATISGGGRGGVKTNRVLDNFGTIGGGDGNKAGNGEGISGDGNADNADYATVGGGDTNTASAADATVAGGSSNIASGSGGAVAGGISNKASGSYAAVAGGDSNNATMYAASIGGGEGNSASQSFATVAGGNQNTASGDSSSVGGGVTNFASGASATIGGGSGNLADGASASVGGGDSNSASGQWSTVGGGLSNRALARLATVAGGGTDDVNVPGRGNVVYDEFGSVAGGSDNQAGANDANATTQRYAVVGGGVGNRALAALATVSGGGGTSNAGNIVYDVGGSIGGGSHNTAGFNDASDAAQNYATVGGGNGNRALGRYATVAGGGGDFQSDGNAIFDAFGTIGGGQANQAGIDDANQAGQQWASVGGGFTNRALAASATVAGGFNNAATGTSSTIGGGQSNNSGGSYATIPGGSNNTANGANSFAAGHRAAANSDGCFVWGDSTEADLSCGGANRFIARAVGGVVFYTNSGATAGVQVAAGGGSWSSVSDRAAKTNITPVDARAVLAKVISTPVHEWSYISQDPTIRHIGPMAQDFHAAFHVGEDDRHITNVDADGVALAAIQGLYQLLHERDSQIAALSDRIQALESALHAPAPAE